MTMRSFRKPTAFTVNPANRLLVLSYAEAPIVKLLAKLVCSASVSFLREPHRKPLSAIILTPSSQIDVPVFAEL